MYVNKLVSKKNSSPEVEIGAYFRRRFRKPLFELLYCPYNAIIRQHSLPLNLPDFADTDLARLQ